ncbi:MAG TPA: hypothetical protein VFZ16_19955 [Hyphomicrobiaceae bacterium]|nr:hypothetical protein [Hyphomicrobiaceae bacterium]
MSQELDQWGFPINSAERMQHAMLSFYDLIEAAMDADFPTAMVGELRQLRLKFLDEFEHRFPGCGQGRAVWR